MINVEKKIKERLKEALKEKLEYWESDIRDDDVCDSSKYDLPMAISDADSFKLYRYMPPTFFSIRNIETQKIHLSPNGVMNDIFEGMPSLIDDLPYNLYDELRDLAYMVCMTETYSNKLMWSHYAQKFEGLCVEYDLKRLEKDPQKIIEHLFPVVYNKRQYIRKEPLKIAKSHKALKKAIAENYEYDGSEPLDDILPLFLVKGEEWEYEKEWRIIYTKKQLYEENDDVLYGGNIEFECISAIYLGYLIHPEIRQNILEICKRISTAYKPISVFQMKIANDSFRIKFEKLTE